jgi:hypothetical protein
MKQVFPMMKHNHSLCAQVGRIDAAPRVADWRAGVMTMYQAAREQEIDTMRRTMAERLCVTAARIVRHHSGFHIGWQICSRLPK